MCGGGTSTTNKCIPMQVDRQTALLVGRLMKRSFKTTILITLVQSVEEHSYRVAKAIGRHFQMQFIIQRDHTFINSYIMYLLYSFVDS